MEDLKREGFEIRHLKFVIWCYPSWYLWDCLQPLYCKTKTIRILDSQSCGEDDVM